MSEKTKIESCAKSDLETASKFISNLNRNFTSLMHDFPSLLNVCLEKVKVVFEVLADGIKSKAESEIVSSLNPVVKDLCQSLKLCLDNVTTQNKLIDEKLVFFVAREKHLGDLKSEREIDLKRVQLDLKRAMQEISQVEDEIRLAEHRVSKAQDAVQASTRRAKEAVQGGITLIVLTIGIATKPALDIMEGAHADLETAKNLRSNAMARVQILNKKSGEISRNIEEQKNQVIAVEGDIRALRKLVSETKNEQKMMQELMKQVKGNLAFLSMLDGKGSVMKNMTIGNTLLLPIINVMLDFVSYSQTHDSQLDWSSMRRELDAFKSSTDFLSVEVKHQFVVDFSDFY